MPLCVKSMRDFVLREVFEKFMTYMLLFWGGAGLFGLYFGG